MEISRHFPHMDKYFPSLWAGVKINCKIVASHKWQWGWVVDLSKTMLNYLLRNPYCKLNAIYFCYFFYYCLFFRNMHTAFSHWSTLRSIASLKLLMQENTSKRSVTRRLFLCPQESTFLSPFAKGSFFRYEACPINSFLENLPVFDVHSKISGILQKLSNKSCKLTLNKQKNQYFSSMDHALYHHNLVINFTIIILKVLRNFRHLLYDSNAQCRKCQKGLIVVCSAFLGHQASFRWLTLKIKYYKL